MSLQNSLQSHVGRNKPVQAIERELAFPANTFVPPETPPRAMLGWSYSGLLNYLTLALPLMLI